MFQNIRQVTINPHWKEEEERQPAENVKKPQMVNFCVFQDLLRENVLQAEAEGRQKRRDEADHVETDLCERCDEHSGDYGH